MVKSVRKRRTKKQSGGEVVKNTGLLLKNIHTIMMTLAFTNGLRIAVKRTVAGSEISSIRDKDGKLLYYDLYESKGRTGLDDFVPFEQYVSTSDRFKLNQTGNQIREEIRGNIMEHMGINDSVKLSDSSGNKDKMGITFESWVENNVDTNANKTIQSKQQVDNNKPVVIFDASRTSEQKSNRVKAAATLGLLGAINVGANLAGTALKA